MSRAYSKVEKLEKRQEILMSAEDLFIKQDGEFPTVSAICTYSSMAKGTVYLYYKNKEEIYLALLEKYFQQWLDPSNINSDDQSIDSVIEALVSFVIKNPYKFKLLNHRHFLETKADTQKVVEFYQNLMGLFGKITSFIADFLDEPIEKVSQWLMDSYYYTQGVWRTANPAYNIQAALAKTEMAIFMPNFEMNTKRLMKLLWQQS